MQTTFRVLDIALPPRLGLDFRFPTLKCILFRHLVAESSSCQHPMEVPQQSSSSRSGTAAMAVAHHESVEHLQGMAELLAIMQNRPMTIHAYALNDPQAPSPDHMVTTSSDATPSALSQEEIGERIQNEENKQSVVILKVVHFVRHGQAFHNLLADLTLEAGRHWESGVASSDNPYTRMEVLDAPLTEIGRQQAYALQPLAQQLSSSTSLHSPAFVVLSTQCRALQTGLIAFDHLIGHVPFMAHDLAREQTGVHVCDQRRPISRQCREFPQVDYSCVEHDDDVLFQATVRESKLELAERIYQFLTWLATRPESCMAVVTHSAWLLTALNGVCQCHPETSSLREWFHTGEMRSIILEFKYHQ